MIENSSPMPASMGCRGSVGCNDGVRPPQAESRKTKINEIAGMCFIKTPFLSNPSYFLDYLQSIIPSVIDV
jgi:hypothetical protein